VHSPNPAGLTGLPPPTASQPHRCRDKRALGPTCGHGPGAGRSRTTEEPGRKSTLRNLIICTRKNSVKPSAEGVEEAVRTRMMNRERQFVAIQAMGSVRAVANVNPARAGLHALKKERWVLQLRRRRRSPDNALPKRSALAARQREPLDSVREKWYNRYVIRRINARPAHGAMAARRTCPSEALWGGCSEARPLL
jgi:hypothetical protein